jgi:hypothetical protein
MYLCIVIISRSRAAAGDGVADTCDQQTSDERVSPVVSLLSAAVLQHTCKHPHRVCYSLSVAYRHSGAELSSGSLYSKVKVSLNACYAVCVWKYGRTGYIWVLSRFGVVLTWHVTAGQYVTTCYNVL